MALTPDELRKRIPQWSLESDGQLLQYMNQISKHLEKTCKETQDNLNRFMLDIDESHIRFANASNSFNGIQQLKYVENRVQDDDESFYSVREEEEEKGEKLPYGDIFHMAVERSVANMYKSFEKVTVQLDSDSDSEDDDEEAAARNTVLRAIQKYPYIGRPLPYIIGSQEWREKWHAGLIDSEEESDTEPKEQYSDSSDSERMFPSQTNSNHTPSESEGSVWGVHSDPRRRAPSIDPSVSGDDALSIHSSSSAIRPRSLLNKVPVLPGFRPPSLFPDQPPPDDTISVSSRNKVTNLFEESDEEESTPTHRPSITANVTNPQPTYFRGNQVERRTVNLFADEPPPSSHEPTPTSVQKKPVNLFVDSDEDDSFNNNSSSKSSSIYRSEPPELPTPARKGSTLFDDEDNAEVTPKAHPSGLFDDMVNNNSVADEEEDLFVPVKRSINGGVAEGKSKGVRRVTNLFDDEPPEDDFDQIFKPKASDRKIPGAKLVLPPVGIGGKQKNVGSKMGNDDSMKKVDSPQQRRAEQVPVVTQDITKKEINLFDNDDDDSNDIFSESVVKKETLAPKTPKINLFDDDEDLTGGSNSLVGQLEASSSTQVKPKETIVNQTSSIRSEILKKKSIFDSDSDEGGDDFLFGGKRSVPSVVKAKEPEPLPRKVEPVVNSPIQLPPVKVEIPDDLPDVEKPSENSEPIQPKPNQASIRSEIMKNKSIFDSDSNEDDGDDDDDVLFGTKQVTSVPDVKKVDISPKIESKVETTNVKITEEVGFSQVDVEKIKDTAKVIEKPQIPDEPPEDDGWEDPPASDLEPKYPEVSNDIDYYLTTNRINGPSESSLVQSNHVDSIKGELKKTAAVEPSKKDIDQDSELPVVEPPRDEDVIRSTEHKVNGDLEATEPLDSENNISQTNDSNKSALKFNSIGLFDDIPPPDDDFFESRTTLQAAVDHTDDGFYSERPTASAGNTAVNSNHYLFMDDGDGPPPDDEVDDGSTAPKQAQEPAPFKSISAIIEERNKNESNYEEETREKPKINRLSAKVNINVNALLPGARRPVAEKTADVPISVEPAIAETSAKVNHPDSEPGPTKLVSLNKGRARIPTKRKPQSRQNRRNNYENSLAPGSSEESPKTHHHRLETPKEEVRVVVGSEERTQHVEVIAAHVKVDQLLSNELIEKLSDLKRLETLTDPEDKLFGDKLSSSTTKPPSAVPVPKNSNPSVVNSVAKPLKPVSSAKLFSDEESDDDDLFGKISKPIVAAQNPTVFKPSQQNIQPNKPLNATIKKQSIFGDSADEDDDLFSKPQSNAKSLPKLIGKPVNSEPSKPTVNLPAKKQSIFGSDDDDDADDLFGGSRRKSSAAVVGSHHSQPKPTKKIEPSKTSKPAALPSTASKSLFGEDDDDDDDLFGSKSKPASKPTSSQPVATTKKMDRNPTTSAKTTATTTTTATVNDPLADLLK
ncbi:hypothetical protein RP20_CCG014403 [Aedes albopictus]|nr:hypothetical protein RP20_CCG014403 [Aedes albopictus]